LLILRLFAGKNVKLNILQKIQKTKETILFLHDFNPTTALIAGSGLGEVSREFTQLRAKQ
jgi:purine-nucleoside phosphorylase